MISALAQFARRHTILTVFTAVYFIAFCLWSWAQGNSEFVFYSAIMVLLIAAVLYMHTRVGFSTPVLWGLALWGLLHMAGGNVEIPASWTIDYEGAPAAEPGSTVLYNLRPVPWVPKYDQFVHAFGFFIGTLAAFQALRAAAGPRLRIGTGILINAVLAGMGLGALNEMIEFIATRFMDTNVGGFVNTGWDLVSNFVGCLAAAFVIGRTRGRIPEGKTVEHS